ncbi:MAG: exodeoxyribonuclease VII small subunit [Bacillaceae bacterium]|jgi:exodeoxyribonuclease VII small subunit|uniref:Exodeoxyribonuclease 7 small subunit n=2 Tax=Aeribacillus TaxID=1055323 RepID=A0A165XSJ4_9BACI|nr:MULTISPECIES: exodeoxyribonuclease VII small subunit [Aeribacillus]AXI40101.1 exodeoxyribonuclease VII small subunit [Bacillaceae bacterium ZC4]REJ18548.1 MAG: exodeoxyribonuclease VII small subunit [Bacillaceae bacterium]ASS91858.1 exodeoxyribonuclease VII small subunit [Aeribacillus pallidus]KZM56839.1 exodeoxyribonuclease VII small subunit [Aeribacillus pallidus]KZN96369.1 exodeoxyribonuclease VII small subunit [Aeribacillus pallidus]
MNDQKELTFEEAMKELEAIVLKLEDGDVPLEQAIQYFQEGMKLSKLCHEKLTQAEKQLDFILDEDGTIKPFQAQEEEQK